MNLEDLDMSQVAYDLEGSNVLTSSKNDFVDDLFPQLDFKNVDADFDNFNEKVFINMNEIVQTSSDKENQNGVEFNVNISEEEKSEHNESDHLYNDHLYAGKVGSLIKTQASASPTYDSEDEQKKVPVKYSFRDRKYKTPPGSPLSDDDSDALTTQVNGKCMSKNAIAARENRMRKKRYVKDLEASVKVLSKENGALKADNIKLKKATSSLEEEVQYLKGILSNVDEISLLIRNVKSTPGLSFATSLSSGASETRRPKRLRSAATKDSEGGNSGVCLHVAQKKISLEFCHVCNAKAQKL